MTSSEAPEAVGMIERMIIGLVATVVLASLLASYLPRLTPSVALLGVVAAILRMVWWYTR
jgi:hypothetical protein